MYIFIILFILLDLLLCLIYALVLIWLGLENWCKRSVSPFFGATLPCVANFGGGEGSCGSYLGLLFVLSLSVCACWYVDKTSTWSVFYYSLIPLVR